MFNIREKQCEDRPRSIRPPDCGRSIRAGQRIPVSWTTNRIDFLNDNSGAELFLTCLPPTACSPTVVRSKSHFALKDHSYFVSDAMPVDVFETVDFIEQRPEPALHTLGRRLMDHIYTGRLALTENPYWTHFLCLPPCRPPSAENSARPSWS